MGFFAETGPADFFPQQTAIEFETGHWVRLGMSAVTATLAFVGFQRFSRDLLERADDITVLGEAGSGQAGIELVTRERPDVVLMDIRMPGGGGLEATRRIVAVPSPSLRSTELR